MRAPPFFFRAVVFTIAQHFTRTLFTTDVEGHDQTREQQHRSQFHRQYVRPEQRNIHCFSTDWRTVDTLIINTKDGVTITTSMMADKIAGPIDTCGFSHWRSCSISGTAQVEHHHHEHEQHHNGTRVDDNFQRTGEVSAE